MDEEEKIYQLSLNMIHGVGTQLWKNLITDLGGGEARNVFKAKKKDLYSYIKNDIIIDDILSKKHVPIAERVLRQHKNNNISIVSFFEENYPWKLKQINDPPAFLYIKGENTLNRKNIISIIGTRNPSAYGEINTEMFIRDLKCYDVIILSGMAYGIDVLAHINALKYGIPTSAIIACGIDYFYPQQHKYLYDKILHQDGAIISEYPLGTKPEKYFFPARNRIIAGCSDAVLIIEAGDKSGTLITAMCANDYDRDVFAIPGDINKNTSLGCNKLIKKDIAHLVTSVEDIVYIMNWEKKNNCGQEQQNGNKNKEHILDENLNTVLNIIKQHQDISLDSIAMKLNVTTSTLTSWILLLECHGLIKTLPGNRFKVLDLI